MDINGKDVPGSEHGPVVGFCGHLNEFSFAVRGEDFLD
jgi:hypothetical protein